MGTVKARVLFAAVRNAYGNVHQFLVGSLQVTSEKVNGDWRVQPKSTETAIRVRDDEKRSVGEIVWK
eukprot:2530925-Pleurochrysis_carterae.AAC.2